MTQHQVHRPARSTRPLSPPQARTIEPPPNLPEGKTGTPATALLPMAGVMSSVVMMTIIRSSQFAGLGAVVLVIALLGAVALFLSQRGKAQRQRRVQRERYLEYLEELRNELSAAERERRRAARVIHPAPPALYDVLRDPARLWERRRTDRDFLDVRAGVGDVPVQELAIGQSAAGNVLTPPDPFMLNEARALQARYATVSDHPLTVPLDRAGNVSVIGDRQDVLCVARALLVQAAVTHAPDDLAIALAVPGDRIEEWEWAKWLPHMLDPHNHADGFAMRRIAPSPAQLAELIGAELGRRASYAAEVRRGLSDRNALALTDRLLVLIDEYGKNAGGLPRPDNAVTLTDMGVTVLHLLAEQVHEPDHVSVRITVDGDRITVQDLRGQQVVEAHGVADRPGLPEAEGLARALAPLRLSAESATEGTPVFGPVEFPQLLGIDDMAGLDPARQWRPRGERDFLRVPIGLDDRHQAVLLDLKESAELGMGPHGLCVGATGSGKSELLRTLVLALVTTHAPDDLAMVLVDYKGGATFAPFAPLPHVAGVITNLENQADLVERVHTSLAGEIKRRQQVLKDAGNIADIGRYRALRTTGRPDLEPLPHLFVVIDEFGELITAEPDFIDLFLSIGRIGRSIGVHLLLSSQRIEGGKLKGLDTYLSYRLGLRTFSADESRTVLDTTDAFHLPPLPGFGYLKVDTSTYTRFKAGFVSGGYRGAVVREDTADAEPLAWAYPAFNTPAQAPAVEEDPPVRRERETGPTVLGIAVGRLVGAAAPVRRIWLPPLPGALTLDSAAGPVRASAAGLRLDHRGGPLQVPLGVLDDPARQWQGPWVHDLNTAGGHTAVIGSPASGKTTLLRTLTLSLALTHTPRDVAVYGLDLAGGGLSVLARLPHVGGIATRTDHERAARTVAEVRAMLAEREEIFRERGIDSVDQLRALRARGELSALGSTDVVLLIDGFGALRDEFAHLDDDVADLLKRGSGYGIHVVAGMLRWNDVRIATQSLFGSRIELRLNDPADSSVDRKLSATLSADMPGRALTDGKLFAQAALPRIDAQPSTDGLGPALEQAATMLRATWHGELAAPVRVLPTRLAAGRLPSATAQPHAIPIGIDQDTLSTTTLDLFGTDQHLLVLGDNECGKTNLLKLISRCLVDRYGTDELVFGIFDPRRGLRGIVPEPYRGGYAHNAALSHALATGIATELAKRLPETADPDALTDEPSFSGPRIVILVDDYDILTAAGQQPLNPFLPYISSARDIGLHFVVTRRVAGASRALYEQFLTALRETGATALVMTGDRTEGLLFPGLYASAQPPGRGTLVRRGRRHQLIQTALAGEADPTEAPV
ncbi:type VII secretion protein EccCa [Streptomyces misionensis]|uniref:Type VII secretion protein EccCa n=1 Tax=Streptomyces misionensis TaxID=67331 RepID=A0A5C6K1I2_9ACTN|nr:type VII secretion protein EccCa [Streptomyces misionensis]TWV56253.1 type VII secretion protein EccCa [Streptomyces misionensis]